MGQLKMKKLMIFVFTLISLIISSSQESTLRLLQIVHRHGDRTPRKFLPNDPYKDESVYWPMGLEKLTLKGKDRMFKVGKYIRENYNDYLGNEKSSGHIYVRSSSVSRCIESTSALLEGVYKPSKLHN